MTATVPPVQTQPREGVWIVAAAGVALAVLLGFAWHSQQDNAPARNDPAVLDAGDIHCVGAMMAIRDDYYQSYLDNGGDRYEDVCRPGVRMSDPAASAGR